MDYIADIILGLGAFGAGYYCLILSRRLKRFNNLQDGMGSAVAVLSAQVDDMTKTLAHAQSAAGQSADVLTALTERAEDSARKLELMMASLHDLPEAPSPQTEMAPELTGNMGDFTSTRSSNPAPKHDIPVFLRHRVMEAAE
ncbi:hypothetical protein SAMN04488030_0301 [Aliiroseovarius halocynthiae]|uniref:Uncharacterized protein n=1 Tax=Aliiroseovarius halocynthiae TaxID=985055 RepID=A0A545SYI6_9RHOB|nr:hypothetical protein [Aliiroseovarius halocynthiae]TQV70021.1 hypothetical protein FIL88_01215 [Aliiroseovarius halocynthiae]SMR70689.1 hypothetical protein SAMN04488030_0301 [Aliiroseovarius halocynthiae]